MEAGIRVAHIGRSGVRHEIDLLAPGEPLAAVIGHFVHVYLDRLSRRSVVLPAKLQRALTALLVAG